MSVFDIPDLSAGFERAQTPEMLYHYTGPAGLIGIATSRTLWSGRPCDLNDRTEQLLIYEALDWQIERIAYGVVTGGDSTVGPDMETLTRLRGEAVGRIPSSETVFTISLSELDDSLDQWRAYCPRSGGVSLGFSSESLREIARKQGFFLGRCSYGNEAEMQWLVDTVLIHATRMVYGWPKSYIPNGAEQQEYSERFAALVFAYLPLVAPLIKHPSFEAEREWRLVCEAPLKERLIAVASNTGLKQFLPLDLVAEGAEALGPVECVIGPNVDPEAMESAVRPILKENFGSSVVRRTESPYR